MLACQMLMNQADSSGISNTRLASTKQLDMMTVADVGILEQ